MSGPSASGSTGPAIGPPERGPAGPSRGRGVLRWAGRIGRGLAVAVVAVLVLLVSGLLPLQAVRIPSDSMTPTVAAGDHLLLDKRHPDTVAVGDVVVVHDPFGDGLLVKRVLAVGGDQIGFEDGILVRNGLPVPEPYTHDFLDGVYYGPDVVPDGQLYLLGDNRFDSIDSRHFGTVPASSVVGLVSVRLFPSPGPLAR